MALILVIESDRRQTSKLTMLARSQLRAELLIVENVTQALAKLDECDPDLILLSAAISGRDQLALGDRLLELEEQGVRIQTLNMPTLGLAGQRARVPQKSAPGRAPVSRGRPAQTDSVDPVVFGMQVSTLLDRIAAERAASGTAVRRRQPAVVVVEEEEPEAIEAAPSIETPAPREIPDPTSRNDWTDLLDAMRREIEVAQSSVQPQPTGSESNTQTVEHDTPATSPETPDPAPAPVAASAPVRKKKVRRVPAQDEFGFFDPQQCGLSALFAKLDTISPPGKNVTPKKPS